MPARLTSIIRKKSSAIFSRGIDEVMFVPYAAVTFTYDAYLEKVQARFSELGIRVRSVHREANPALAIMSAKRDCRRRRQHVPSRTNDATRRAGRSDPTKSDRRRDSLCGLERGQQHGLPDHRHHERHADHRARHFPCRRTDPVPDQPPLPRRTPQGHAGETREQRIEEYITVNTNVYVAGLREGCMLRLEGDRLSLIGPRPMRIFRWGRTAP